MYEAHFGLKKPLFDKGIAQDATVFLAPKHEAILANIKVALTTFDSALVLTGAAGVGKTTLISAALRTTSTRLALGWITAVPANAAELLELLLLEFGFNAHRMSRVERMQMWRQFLNETNATSSRVYVIAERAEDLAPEVLRAADALTAADASGSLGANLVLLGQPALADHLKSPVLESLCQRIRLRQRLDALTHNELAAYLEHHVKLAGGMLEKIFAPGAIRALHDYSGGIPRVLNNLCESALSLAASGGEAVLSADVVTRVAVGLFGMEPLEAADEAWPNVDPSSAASVSVTRGADSSRAPSATATSTRAVDAPAAAAAPAASRAPFVPKAPAPVASAAPSASSAPAASAPRAVPAPTPSASPSPAPIASAAAAAPSAPSSVATSAAPPAVGPTGAAASRPSAAQTPPAAPPSAPRWPPTSVPPIDVASVDELPVNTAIAALDFPVLTDAIESLEAPPPRPRTETAYVTARAQPTPPRPPPQQPAAASLARGAPFTPQPRVPPSAAEMPPASPPAPPAATVSAPPAAPSAAAASKVPSTGARDPAEADLQRQTQTMRALAVAKTIDDISNSMAETLFSEADLEMLSAALEAADWSQDETIAAESVMPTMAAPAASKPTAPTSAASPTAAKPAPAAKPSGAAVGVPAAAKAATGSAAPAAPAPAKPTAGAYAAPAPAPSKPAPSAAAFAPSKPAAASNAVMGKRAAAAPAAQAPAKPAAPQPSKPAASKPAASKPPAPKPASTAAAPQPAQKPMLEEDPFDFLGLGNDAPLELIDEDEADGGSFKKAAHDA